MKMSFVVNFNLCVQWTFQSKEGLNSSKQNSTLQRQSRCWDPHFWSLRCCFQSKLLVGVSQLKYSNFTPPGVQGAQKKKKTWLIVTNWCSFGKCAYNWTLSRMFKQNRGKNRHYTLLFTTLICKYIQMFCSSACTITKYYSMSTVLSWSKMFKLSGTQHKPR